MSLETRVVEARRRLDQRVGEFSSLNSAVTQTQREIEELKSTIEVLEKAAIVLSSISEERQESTQATVESLVSQGLQTIFGDEMTFHMSQKLRGRSVCTEFFIKSQLGNGTVVETPVMESRGGGVAAVVGFLLRVVLMLLSGKPGVLFLDETFGMLSSEYEIRLAEFIRELVDKTGVQIIMVTHSDAYSDFADKKYRFTLKSGITEVVEL